MRAKPAQGMAHLAMVGVARYADVLIVLPALGTKGLIGGTDSLSSCSPMVADGAVLFSSVWQRSSVDFSPARITSPVTTS
jgi:hypothetical protein